MNVSKIKAIVAHKFLNNDGTINKTVLASAITLLIVLVDQILAVFDVIPEHQDQVIAVLNTVLTILSLFGFVEGPNTASILNLDKDVEVSASTASSAVSNAETQASVTASVAASVALDVAQSAVATSVNDEKR